MLARAAALPPRVAHPGRAAARRISTAADDGGSAGTTPPEALRRCHVAGKNLHAFHRSHKLATSAEVARMAELIFESLRGEASVLADSPLAGPIVKQVILAHGSLTDALASTLAGAVCVVKDGSPSPRRHDALCDTLRERLREPRVLRGIVTDVSKAVVTDPAAVGLVQPTFLFKGFLAVTTHRVAHSLWRQGDAASRLSALHLQTLASEAYGVDIHPAAVLGNGLLLDHATGVVVGETAVVGDDVYMLHGVTLGATGRPLAGAKRHPTIEAGATLGAGCSILGPLTVGAHATVGSKAVVTRDVPRHGTVVGVNQMVNRRESAGASDEFDFTWMYHRSTSVKNPAVKPVSSAPGSHATLGMGI